MKGEIPEGETLAREYLANERTLLSWVRTGINSISVGILVYLAGRVLGLLYGETSQESLPLFGSKQAELGFIGLSLVVLGALVELVAVVRFIQYKASINRGTFTSSALLYLLIIFGIVLVGVAYIIYIILG